MAYQCLIFDRVRVNRVALAGDLPDGKAFRVHVENIGEGRPARGTVRVEVSDSTLLRLSEPADAWIRKTIRTMGNAQQNDGRKVPGLIGRGPISLDSSWVI